MKAVNKGFSLIELMVTIAVIGILAAIAIPSYLEYVLRSRRADAKAALLSGQLAQEKWRANHTTYGSLANIGISSTSQDGYYTITVSGTSATAYSISAVPKSPHEDSKCGTLTINQSNNKTATGDDGYCWGK